MADAQSFDTFYFLFSDGDEDLLVLEIDDLEVVNKAVQQYLVTANASGAKIDIEALEETVQDALEEHGVECGVVLLSADVLVPVVIDSRLVEDEAAEN